MIYDVLNEWMVMYRQVQDGLYWVQMANDEETGVFMHNPTFKETLGDLLIIKRKGHKPQPNTPDQPVRKKKVTAVNQAGERVKTYKEDKRFETGELVLLKDLKILAVTVKGHRIKVFPNDTRLQSGELKAYIPDPQLSERYKAYYEQKRQEETDGAWMTNFQIIDWIPTCEIQHFINKGWVKAGNNL